MAQTTLKIKWTLHTGKGQYGHGRAGTSHLTEHMNNEHRGRRNKYMAADVEGTNHGTLHCTWTIHMKEGAIQIWQGSHTTQLGRCNTPVGDVIQKCGAQVTLHGTWPIHIGGGPAVLHVYIYSTGKYPQIAILKIMSDMKCKIYLVP